MACWNTKAAMSLKPVKMEESYYGGLTGTLLNRTIPTPYGLLYLKIGGSQPHPKLQSLLSQELVKLRTSDFVCTFRGSIGKKPIKNFRKSSHGRTHYSGTPENVQGTPSIYRAHRTVIFAVAQISCQTSCSPGTV